MKTKTPKTDLKKLLQGLTSGLQPHKPYVPDREPVVAPVEEERPKLKIAPRTMKKIEALMALDKITRPDLKPFTDREADIFSRYLSEELVVKKDRDRDIFLEKIEGIILPEVNDSIRERNHIKIHTAIVNSLKQRGRMPGKTEIARATGLSRITVQKHMKEFEASDDFKEQLKAYRYVKTNVMDSIIKAAVNGDMRAAKLYLAAIDKLPGNETQTTILNQQNNFVHLHGVTFNLQQLPADKLKAIEEIVKGVLVVKE